MRCYLCRKESLKVIRNNVRHEIPRDVLECQHCGLNYLKPKEEDLEHYYAENYRKKYTCVVGETIECKKQFDLVLPYQQARFDEIKHLLNKDAKVLDVGCSTGHFLYTIQKYVKECIGIEYNISEAEFTNKELGIKTYNTSIEKTDLPNEYFDIITMYQVLEHVDDPIELLKNYKKYLKPNGYIVIEVPNIYDILISGYEVDPYVDFWFREPHLFNFSAKSLTMILEKAGFKGTIKGFQCYNFLNHLNWLFTGKPQKSIDEAWSKPKLIKDNSLPDGISNDINHWFKRVDEEYKKLLVKHKLSESILYIGQKIN